MCAKFISTLPDRGSGLGADVAYFREFAEDLLDVTRTSALEWLQLVNETERPAFEAAAVAAAQRLDASGALAAQVRDFGIRAAPDGGELTAAQRPTLVRAPPAPLHAAVWANAPRNFTPAFYLFDILSEPVRREAMQRAIDTSAPAITEPTPFTFADAPGHVTPSAVIFAPAWPYLRANRTYGLDATVGGAAVCGIAFHWDTVLQDALPSFVNSIVAVLRSPGGAEYTFQIRGREVQNVGVGDATGRLARRFTSLAQRADVEVAGATWRVTLFPTDELRRRHMTNKPRDFALGIAAAGAVCALLFMRCFLWFEFCDRHRIQRVNARLLAYVADLEYMQQQLAEGHAREAEAKARVLAEEASSRSKDAFVAMVSHEIRTPLNAVSGAAALLAATTLDGEQRELVTLLEAGTAHVVLIVEDILLAGALASGAFAVARERLRLETVVLGPAWRMVLMQRSQQTKLRALRLSRGVADDVPVEIVGDCTRLTQVLTNILSNSIKFTPEGGAIQLQVDVTDEPPPGWVPQPAVAAAAAAEQQAPRWLRFRVSDTGIGISAGALRAALCICVWLVRLHTLLELTNCPSLPQRTDRYAENIERVFLPFTQAEQSTVRQYGGTGLGLTVRACGGRMPFSTFRFTQLEILALTHLVVRCALPRTRTPSRRSAAALRAPWAAT
jgi:signal transduction histidine kinase